MFSKTLVEKEFLRPVDRTNLGLRAAKALLWMLLLSLVFGGVCAADPAGTAAEAGPSLAADLPEAAAFSTVESTYKNGDGEDENELEMEIDPIPVQNGSLAAPSERASFSGALRSLLSRLLSALEGPGPAPDASGRGGSSDARR